MIPPMIQALWNTLRTPQRSGTALIAITATRGYTGGGHTIDPGDMVLYSAPKPESYAQLDGQIVAVSDGHQIVFGEAKVEGHAIKIHDQTFPRHLVRGIIFAVVKKSLLSQHSE